MFVHGAFDRMPSGTSTRSAGPKNERKEVRGMFMLVVHKNLGRETRRPLLLPFFEPLSLAVGAAKA